jgi:hypothetical protein
MLKIRLASVLFFVVSLALLIGAGSIIPPEGWKHPGIIIYFAYFGAALVAGTFLFYAILSTHLQSDY